MRYLLCPLLAVWILFMGGCSEQQIARAEAFSAKAHTALEQAQHDLAIAQEVAKTLEAEKAAAYIAMAQRGVEMAQMGVTKADELLESAKSGNWMQTISGLVFGLISAGIPLIGAVRSGVGWKQAAIQTFRGLQDVRKTMGDEAWDNHVAPSLESAQDDKVKQTVKKVVG